jgi:hypothetical protein
MIKLLIYFKNIEKYEKYHYLPIIITYIHIFLFLVLTLYKFILFNKILDLFYIIINLKNYYLIMYFFLFNYY